MFVKDIFHKIYSSIKGSPAVLRSVFELAIELAREGREGRKIGTIFTVGDHEHVQEHSRPLILDPLLGHPDSSKRLDNPDMRETTKELAQLDGAFIVSSSGVIQSAARYLEAPTSDVTVPLGLGTRHLAAAAITKCTEAVAVVVSTSAIVRIFHNGRIIGEILPELWLIGRESIYIPSPRIDERKDEKVTIVTPDSDKK
jgi:DNA integrity scanning protein DisA with diadenylate cyclase activity